MPRVICKLPNASELIGGIKFDLTEAGHRISEEISEAAAVRLAGIPGYERVDEDEAAKKAAEAAEIAAKEAAEKAAAAKAAADKAKAERQPTAKQKAAAEKAEKEAAEKAAAEKAAQEKAAEEAAELAAKEGAGKPADGPAEGATETEDEVF